MFYRVLSDLCFPWNILDHAGLQSSLRFWLRVISSKNPPIPLLTKQLRLLFVSFEGIIFIRSFHFSSFGLVGQSWGQIHLQYPLLCFHSLASVLQPEIQASVHLQYPLRCFHSMASVLQPEIQASVRPALKFFTNPHRWGLLATIGAVFLQFLQRSHQLPFAFIMRHLRRSLPFPKDGKFQRWISTPPKKKRNLLSVLLISVCFVMRGFWYPCENSTKEMYWLKTWRSNYIQQAKKK